MAEGLFTLAPDGWHSPIQSGYGWHLVWVGSIKAGRVPAFEEVGADIKSAWINDQYEEIKRAALGEMRSRHTVDLVALVTADLRDLAGPARSAPCQSQLHSEAWSPVLARRLGGIAHSDNRASCQTRRCFDA
ncbi:peptidylprolyl isomerase [Roseovarius sp. M141]|uniref:peptidylprolyl isomerase n=1 Tax=Roseovarius sp. M141 TaxID=2583806 RepID=UPI00337489FB|nr:peptidyl-prolyl cis-trans isomerase [Roseovarius sp. M141]